MLFNSIQFAIFFPLVTVLYFVLPHRFRWALLLAASCIFYMAFLPAYILILFFTITVDYVAALAITKAEGSRRKQLLAVSILANLGVLALFKYGNFVTANLAALAAFLDWNYPIPLLGILLPIGLSFHTFQSIAYTVEVYRGRQEAERHPGIFALYVMFYPQLVAGPIERPQHMLHQFREKHRFEYARVSRGLERMLWGFFKKVVIADRLAILVNNVYNQPRDHTGLTLIVATLFFAYQIYCDFSGYSDIALGAAQVMGFRLMENFQRPYRARSIPEFWSRWHISLSTWFRDYVYIPLGGNRVGPRRWRFNIMLTFLLSGLWHGANWTFVLWGALHGLYMLASAGIGKLADGIPLARRFAQSRVFAAISVLVTFLLVTFAWILFRAGTITEAWYVMTHLFTGISAAQLGRAPDGLLGLGLDQVDLSIAWASIAILEFVQFDAGPDSLRRILATKPTWFRWAAYYALAMWILLFGVFSHQQFIYFQF